MQRARNLSSPAQASLRIALVTQDDQASLTMQPCTGPTGHSIPMLNLAAACHTAKWPKALIHTDFHGNGRKMLHHSALLAARWAGLVQDQPPAVAMPRCNHPTLTDANMRERHTQTCMVLRQLCHPECLLRRQCLMNLKSPSMLKHFSRSSSSMACAQEAEMFAGPIWIPACSRLSHRSAFASSQDQSHHSFVRRRPLPHLVPASRPLAALVLQRLTPTLQSTSAACAIQLRLQSHPVRDKWSRSWQSSVLISRPVKKLLSIHRTAFPRRMPFNDLTAWYLTPRKSLRKAERRLRGRPIATRLPMPAFTSNLNRRLSLHRALSTFHP